MDPRFRRRLRPIASIVLVFFSWFCIEPWNYALAAQAASKQRPSASKKSHPKKAKSAAEKFEGSLRATKDLVEELDRDLAEDKDIGLTLGSLKAQGQAIDAADTEIQAAFAETEANLKTKNLPSEILERHRKAVAEYKDNFKKFKADLQAITALEGARKKAEKNRDRVGERAKRNALKDRIRGLKADLKEKVKDRQHTPLDPNKLPFRTPKANKREPRLKKEEFTEFHKPIQLAFNGDPSLLQLAQANPDLPTPQDLSETIEVQFTQEIQDLAASLENNPVKIYNWVRNHIDFVPTWGSIQGGDYCLRSKLCNTFDTASLLIALFRASGISARYVTGTIIVPIDQVKNWAGHFSDNQSAVEFITSGGVPAAGGIIGGQIVEARMEHVWVEAYVDYIPSRGAVHKNGDTWIPLDPSFKQYDFSQTIDLQTAVPFDGTSFLNQVEATATIDYTAPSVTNVDSVFVSTTLDNYQNQIQTYLTNNAPTATLGEVLGTRSIKSQNFPILPATLPYKKILTGATYSEIPDALRHKLTFEVTTNAAFGPDFTHTASLPALAGKRITLSYAAATTADQDIIDSYAEAFATSIPAYLLQFRPELKIDGVTTASGPAIGMATPQDFTLTFTAPSFGQDQVVHSLLVGDYSAVGLNLSTVNADMLQGRIDLNDFSEPVGEMLHQTLLSYWGEVDAFNGILASQTQVNTLRHPSEGLAASKVDATFLFGAPNAASYKSRTLDIARDLQTAIHQGGDKSISFSYFIQAGTYSSVLEGLIFDQLFSANLGDGVSAIRIMELANNQGVPIYNINVNNVSAILPLLEHSDSIKSSVQNAVSAGKVVQIPKQEISHNGWEGVGYIVLDPTNGAGAYLISGGLSGGAGKTPGETTFPLPQVPASPIILLVISALAAGGGIVVGAAAIVVVGGAIVGLVLSPSIAEASTGAPPIPSADPRLTVLALIVGLLIGLISGGIGTGTIEDGYPSDNIIILRHYTKAERVPFITPPFPGIRVFGDTALIFLTDLRLHPVGITNAIPNNEYIALALELFDNDNPGVIDPSKGTGYIELRLNLAFFQPGQIRFFKPCILQEVNPCSEWIYEGFFLETNSLRSQVIGQFP